LSGRSIDRPGLFSSPASALLEDLEVAFEMAPVGVT
jgi:hypothetical protein